MQKKTKKVETDETNVRLISDEEREAMSQEEKDTLKSKVVTTWELVGDLADYAARLGIKILSVTFGASGVDGPDLKVFTILNPRYSDEEHTKIIQFNYSEPDVIINQSRTIERMYVQSVATCPDCESCPERDICVDADGRGSNVIQ